MIALALLAVLASGTDGTAAQIALEQCMETASTSLDFNDCYAAALQAADDDLNTVWKKLMAALEDQPEARESLRSEQRKWIAFKDESCSFYWGAGFGSMHRSIIGPSCRLGIIEARTAQLNIILSDLEMQ